MLLIRNGPGLIAKKGQNKAIMKLSGLGCQLLPLALFYVVILLFGIPMQKLSETGWTFPAQAGRSFWGLWTTYSLRDADVDVLLSNVSSMLMLVIMSVPGYWLPQVPFPNSMEMAKDVRTCHRIFLWQCAGFHDNAIRVSAIRVSAPRSRDCLRTSRKKTHYFASLD